MRSFIRLIPLALLLLALTLTASACCRHCRPETKNHAGCRQEMACKKMACDKPDCPKAAGNQQQKCDKCPGHKKGK